MVFIVNAQGVTTGSMSGKVFDKANKSTFLVGATVSALHIPTGSKYGAIVRSGGSYTIKGMRIGGPYTVKVSYVGYTTSIIENVNIDLGTEERIDFSLNPTTKAGSEVVVTATADQTFNAQKTGSGSTISEQEITAAPTINRSLSDFARINPYTNQSSSFGGDDGLQGISIGGQNSRFNNIQIDGAVANDMFGLGQAGTAGSQANANFVSLDAIQELQVNVSPYDIRQGGFTGGIVNAITRGGTNKFKGSVFTYGRNESFVGTSPDVSRRPFAEFSDFQFGGRVGGPIIKDELFFHVTAEVRLRRRPLELGLSDPTALNNFPYPKSTIDEISRIAKERFGYDAGNSDLFITRNNTYNIIARLDWNINKDNKLQFRHNYTNAFQDRNVQRTARIFSLSSQWNEFRSINNSSVLQLNSVLSDGASNELRLAITQTNDQRVLQADPFPQVTVLLSNNESVVFGPERSSQANSLDQTQIALTNDLTFYEGDNVITIGTHNEYNRFNNLFIQDNYGSYTFKDIQAFRDSTPSFYRLSYPNTNVTGNTLPRAAWSMLQTSVYAMNEWRPFFLPGLRVTTGIRMDVPIYLSTPYENTVFTQRVDSLSQFISQLDPAKRVLYPEFPGQLSTAELPSPQFMFSPRLGFNYDVLGDRTFQLRGGTGLFTGRVAAVWLSNQFSNTGVDLFRVEVGQNNNQLAGLLRDINGNNLVVDLNPLTPPKPGDGRFSGATQTTSVINVLDRNFRNPQVWRSTLAADFVVDKGISITIEGMYSYNLNQIDFRNLNNKPSSGTNGVSPVDGRPLYARNPTTARNDSNNIRDFLQILYMTNRDGGYQYSGMAQLSVRENNFYMPGIAFNLAATWSRAMDFTDGTSSVALSNWQSTDSYDPNKTQVSRSSFDVPFRVNANATYRLQWKPLLGINTSTSFGIFYSGNSGRPYSFTYQGDFNGDGVSNNDLIYVPHRDDLGKKVLIINSTPTVDLRTPDQIWSQLMDFIDANPLLKDYQGKVLERNALREPWINQLDIRIAQNIPTVNGESLEITLDIQNALNLLNRDWGLQRFVNFQSYSLFGTDATQFDSQGRLRMVYNAPITNNRPGIYETDNFFSRWRMQLGIRYTF